MRNKLVMMVSRTDPCTVCVLYNVNSFFSCRS